MLITRRDPALPLTRLRANHKVNEVRTRDLQFTGPETTGMLEKVTGLTVSDDVLAQLQRQLEGWVVGLRLVVLAMGDAESPAEMLTGMSGGIQQTQEYLLQEVLTGRSRQMQDWMLKASILDRFCAPLCTTVCADNAASGGSDLDGGQFVEGLQRWNLFIIPLDAEGKWFRFHHSFQELLANQLMHCLGANEINTLHLRAATWFEQEHLVDEALGHAIDGGHIEEAADIIERNLQPVMDEGSWYIVMTWLSRLPNSMILARPELILAHAYTYYYRREFNRILPILDRIEGLVEEDPLSHRFSGEVALFRGLCAYFDGDFASSMQHLEQAIDQIPETKKALMAIGESFCMFASYHQGQGKRVRSEATRWLDDETLPHPLRKTTIVHTILLLDYFAGDLEAVKRGILKQREFTRIYKMENFSAWCDFLEGLCHLQQGDFDAAIRLLEAAGKSKYRHFTQGATDAMAALTIVYQMSGAPLKAASSLQSLGEFASQFGPLVAGVAESCAARLRILQGHSEPTVWRPETRAARTVEPMGQYFEIPCVTRCRTMIAEGTTEGLAEAQQELQTLIEMSDAQHCTNQSIGLLSLQAAAFNRQNNTEGALAALERAVELARPGGFVFPFLELGQPMFDLLNRLPQGNENDAFIKRILGAFEGPAGGEAEVDIRQHRTSRLPIEQLTNREQEILELLGQRLFDKEIAAKLHISASTVNSHCKNIYQKLGVGNRRQAVAEGIDLGILDGGPR